MKLADIAGKAFKKKEKMGNKVFIIKNSEVLPILFFFDKIWVQLSNSLVEVVRRLKKSKKFISGVEYNLCLF